MLKHMNAEARALDYFHQGYNCAQSVFAAFAAQVGMSDEAALRFSSAFGAGLGRMRGTCGAFSALCMVAGFCQGNLTGQPEEKERIFTLTRALADDFKAEFGTLTCRELLHLDEEMEPSARPNERTEAYYAARPCERCVAFCARKAQELLHEQA
ncbi:MAG: C_GCAxxG_C_C family protein [Akkermansia sp.]|nr:C_GCAxxG_C_C family protein [Akkermansia sp.]